MLPRNPRKTELKMSSFDRVWPETGERKGAFDQILSSWFLDSSAKNLLASHILRTLPLQEFQETVKHGFFQEEDCKYLPVFYKQQLPSRQSTKAFLSFRKMNKPGLKYGYVLVRFDGVDKAPSLEV
jgi:hypothetical protein